MIQVNVNKILSVVTSPESVKSTFHNIGVIIVGFVLAFIYSVLDLRFGFKSFVSTPTILIGILLLILGFIIRVWATYYFYKSRMKVIVLNTQGNLITTGPYRYSRNPLYIGGNVFIFFGASLVLGTPTGILITLIHLPLLDLMIRKEERQLEKAFGKDWLDYKAKVPRWV